MEFYKREYRCIASEVGDDGRTPAAKFEPARREQHPLDMVILTDGTIEVDLEQFAEVGQVYTLTLTGPEPTLRKPE